MVRPVRLSAEDSRAISPRPSRHARRRLTCPLDRPTLAAMVALLGQQVSFPAQACPTNTRMALSVGAMVGSSAMWRGSEAKGAVAGPAEFPGGPADPLLKRPIGSSRLSRDTRTP